MGALPKKKTTTHRRGRRRAQLKLSAVQTQVCPQCGQPKLAHQACPACGYYKAAR